MKRIILYGFILISLLSSSFAANFYPTNVDFDKNQINTIEDKIENLNSKYRLNFDVFVLKNDHWGCSRKSNYMDCIENNVGIQSDGFFAINVDKRHMESWIRSQYDSVLTTNQLKNLEENIVYYLGDDDWYGWIDNYLDQLDTKLNGVCNKLKENNYTTNCHLDNLLSWVEQQQMDYRQELLKKEQEMLERTEQKRAVVKKITQYIPIIWTILIILNILYKKITIYLKKREYKKQLTALLKDVNYLKLQVNSDDNLLEKDKKELYTTIDRLHSSLEQTVANFHDSISELEKDYNYYLNEINAFHRDYKKKRNIDMGDINQKLDNVYNTDI